MKNIISIITIIAIAFTMTITPSFASVEGITAENYLSYEKSVADTYGYNKGECETPYLEGEEYFYNECYDHWNVDKVYDRNVLVKIGYLKKATAKKYHNLKIAKKWTKKHYKGYKIKVVKYNKVPKKRKSTKKIYIEKIPTISDGGYNGHCTIDGSYVRYSKKVAKGTKQTCYCVWNPKNNACDDVVAFANCNTIK